MHSYFFGLEHPAAIGETIGDREAFSMASSLHKNRWLVILRVTHNYCAIAINVGAEAESNGRCFFFGLADVII